jgi:hypothetical protein
MGNIGVNISEIEANGIGILQSASVYNGGILVQSPKAPLGKAFLVNSIEAYESIFGRANYNYNSWYMMKGLFQNVGSQKPNLYIVREYDTNSIGTSAANIIGELEATTTGDDDSENLLTVEAGYMGDESPGVWGNNLRYSIIAGNTSGKFIFRIFEVIGSNVFLVESTPEWDLSDVVNVVNSFSKYIKVTLVGSPVVEVTTPVAQEDTLTVTASSGNAMVGIKVGNMASALLITVPYNDSEAQTAEDLADAINDADIGVTATYDTGASFPVLSDTAGVAIVYSDLTGVEVASVTSNGSNLIALEGGVDPGVPSNSGAISNMDALLTKDIQRVFSTERTSFGWASSLEAWCSSTKGDVLGLISTKSTETPSGDFTEYSPLLIANSFIAAYFNWGYVDSAVSNGEKLIPLLGHIYGAYYCRKRQNNGGFAHIAPGGVNVSLRGINRLQFIEDLTPETVTKIVRTNGINVVNFVPRYGFVVESSRTMSTTNKYYSIHIRESKNFLIQSFRYQLKVFQQRPNNSIIRSSLRSTINLFLGKRYEEGMFDDVGGFENNVKVICDETNNGINVRKNRQLVADIILNFVEISEEVNLHLIQADGNLQVVEE